MGAATAAMVGAMSLVLCGELCFLILAGRRVGAQISKWKTLHCPVKVSDDSMVATRGCR